MIAECPYALECRVTETKDGDGSWIVFGEVVGAYSDEKYLTGGKADPMKSDPFVLVMPGGGYHRIGERIADAWGCGNTLLDQAPEK
jgi:flavin reductase (DIM6/NTAB) family NADH-FMN oxidoreductase RutF